MDMLNLLALSALPTALPYLRDFHWLRVFPELSKTKMIYNALYRMTNVSKAASYTNASRKKLPVTLSPFQVRTICPVHYKT